MVRRVDIDLAPVRELLALIEGTYQPLEIWLFGSRARGTPSAASDWDLFVIVPDDAPESLLDPLVGWRLRKRARIRADVIPCRSSEFQDSRDTPNTLAYVIAREGVLVHGG